jgi:hypothetical protein
MKKKKKILLKKEPANLFDIWKKSDFSSFEMRLSFWL